MVEEFVFPYITFFAPIKERMVENTRDSLCSGVQNNNGLFVLLFAFAEMVNDDWTLKASAPNGSKLTQVMKKYADRTEQEIDRNYANSVLRSMRQLYLYFFEPKAYEASQDSYKTRFTRYFIQLGISNLDDLQAYMEEQELFPITDPDLLSPVFWHEDDEFEDEEDDVDASQMEDEDEEIEESQIEGEDDTIEEDEKVWIPYKKLLRFGKLATLLKECRVARDEERARNDQLLAKVEELEHTLTELTETAGALQSELESLQERLEICENAQTTDAMDLLKTNPELQDLHEFDLELDGETE